MTGDNVNPTGDSRLSSSSLIEKIRARDDDAWNRFVHLFTPLVYKWCRQAGLQEADAADVGQDVFRAVFRAIEDYKHDGRENTLRGWLRTITQNKMIDHFRRRKEQGAGGTDAHEQLQQLPAPVLAEENDASQQEDRLLVYRRAVDLVLSECEEPTRRAFLAFAVEQRPAADVADELGISVNAVYLAKSRVLRRLREEFAELVAPLP